MSRATRGASEERVSRATPDKRTERVEANREEANRVEANREKANRVDGNEWGQMNEGKCMMCRERTTLGAKHVQMRCGALCD